MFSLPAKERYIKIYMCVLLFLCQAARPALNAASSFGHDDVVEFLLDHGASVNAVDGVRTQSGIRCSLI